MTSRPAPGVNRELRLSLLLVLAGATLVLFAAGRPWIDLVVPQAPPLPARTVVRTGSDLVPALSPLGLLGLAGVAALAATRGRGRVPVGLLLLGAGVAACATTVATVSAGVTAALEDPARGVEGSLATTQGFTAWPHAALAGGLLLALGGLVVAARGGRWAALSARYDPPAARAARPPAGPEVAAWEALDRGEDPTRDPERDARGDRL